MAIAPSVPGLEVTIEVDNVALPEYQYEDEGTPIAGHEAFDDSVTKYLEVPVGAEFSVRWLLKPPFESTAATHADVMLDGCFLQAPFRETGDRDTFRGYKYAKTIVRQDAQGFTQSFRFSELETDDSTLHTTLDLKRRLEGIGCITVYLYRVISETESRTTNVPQLELNRCDPMSEKIAQKGASTVGDVLTHQASLTAPQPMHSSTLHQVQTENNFFASYTFHYRSTRALQSLGIIPRTPSPSPSPTFSPGPGMRDPDTMTREELIVALTKTKKLAETVVRIKREREDSDADASDDVDDNELIWTGTRPAKKRAFVVLEE
ncbi:hypothetical protein M3J07_010165 [Ascochyta lentis]